MQQNNSKSLILLISLFICSVVGVVAFILFYISVPLTTNNTTSIDATLATTDITSGSIANGASIYVVSENTITAPDSVTIQIPDGYSLSEQNLLPTFIIHSSNQLIIKADKTDIGTYRIYVKDLLSDLYNENIYMEINVVLKDVDYDSISTQIGNFLGSEAGNYGIYLYDLNRGKEMGVNADSAIRAASMVKIPIAVTVMKEIEEGRLSLDTVYPLRSDLIFNTEIGAAENPVGSNLTVRDYLTYMITESDNTSLSHLDALLSATYGSNLNQKIKAITGVDFYVNPPEATPVAVGTVLKNLYLHKYLSADNSEYIISLMKSAVPDLKRGIGLGLPSNIDFANKIGFLNTDEDLSYMDSAIVYGSSTDYVLVIMDKKQDWDVAQKNIQTISSIIYNALN